MSIEYKVKDADELKKLEDGMSKISCSFVPDQEYLVEYLPFLYEGTIQIKPVNFDIVKIERGNMQFIGMDNKNHHIFLKNGSYTYRIHLDKEEK